jgi:hypothetical protein
MFDARSFCEVNGVEYAGAGHRHYRKGWVNIVCPFCFGNPGYHGGINEESAYYSCYRCGSSYLPKVISKTLGIGIGDAHRIFKQFLSDDIKLRSKRRQPRELKLPRLIPLTDRHRRYLSSRRFDPDKIIRDFGISSTGPIGIYRHKIFVPVYWQERMVSFQCRTTKTGKQDLRYMGCELENEIIEHKRLLYNFNPDWTRVIIVEGITDVWRLGGQSAATFGIEYTTGQIRRIVESNVKVVRILFDDEYQAQLQAETLGTQLLSYNLDVDIYTLTSAADPADLTDNEAELLMMEVFK